MKVGMKVICQHYVRNQVLGNRWIWLCEAQDEWATYISTLADLDTTEFGHYFWNKKEAVNDFNDRIISYQ